MYYFLPRIVQFYSDCHHPFPLMHLMLLSDRRLLIFSSYLVLVATQQLPVGRYIHSIRQWKSDLCPHLLNPTRPPAAFAVPRVLASLNPNRLTDLHTAPSILADLMFLLAHWLCPCIPPNRRSIIFHTGRTPTTSSTVSARASYPSMGLPISNFASALFKAPN